MALEYPKTFAVVIEPVYVKKPKYLRQTHTKNVNPKHTLAPGYPKMYKIQKSTAKKVQEKCRNVQETCWNLPKLIQVLYFQNFATIHFTRVKIVVILRRVLCGKNSREWKVRMRTPWGPTRGHHGPKMAEIDQNL